MQATELRNAVRRAVDDGLLAAALLDRDGGVIAIAGALLEEEVQPIAGIVTRRFESDAPLRRMLAGEMLEVALDERAFSVGIAGRRMFVVVLLGDAQSRDVATALRRRVDDLLQIEGTPQHGGGSGGSSSGPAELPVIEIGVTVKRGKA